MNIFERVFSSKVAGLHLQLHLRMNFLTGIFKYFAYIWGTPTSLLLLFLLFYFCKSCNLQKFITCCFNSSRRLSPLHKFHCCCIFLLKYTHLNVSQEFHIELKHSTQKHSQKSKNFKKEKRNKKIDTKIHLSFKEYLYF